MAKVSQEQRQLFQSKIKIYKAKIEEYEKEVKKINLEISKNAAAAPMLRVKVANFQINLITTYCGMNELSIDLMDVKNTSYIEKARRLLYDVIISFEKTVTRYVDVPFSDYAEGLKSLEEITDEKRLQFVRKIGYCIDLIKASFGENTKWKWSFVEIEGRYSVVVKNMFDLRRYQKLDDPRQEGFRERKRYINIMQDLLQESSQAYRQKYELTTNDVEDLKRAIDYQKALLRISTVTNEPDKIQNCKKQIDVWNTLLEKKMAEKEKRKM